jgi:transposase
MTKHLSELVKLLAINYYKNNDLTQQEVANIFSVTKRTLQNWLNAYENNTLSRKKKIGKSYKVKEKHIKLALSLIKKYPHVSIQSLWIMLRKKYIDFTITPQHLGVVVRDQNITRKRTTRRHFPKTRYGKTINLKEMNTTFYKEVDKYELSKIVCLDEISVSVQMKPNYSRCELGKRCLQKTTNNNVFKKFTLLVAINSKGVIGWILYKNGGITAERLIDFIEMFIKNKIKNCLIIMDNAGAHRNKLIQKSINESGNQLHYSIPYKPKTNAIETWFSQFKHHLIQIQGNGVSYCHLKSTIKKTIKNIKKEHYKNILKYAYQKKDVRKTVLKNSTRRKKPKLYKK